MSRSRLLFDLGMGNLAYNLGMNWVFGAEREAPTHFDVAAFMFVCAAAFWVLDRLYEFANARRERAMGRQGT